MAALGIRMDDKTKNAFEKFCDSVADIKNGVNVSEHELIEVD